MVLRASHIPVRLATGAFILNSGLSKIREGDEEFHKQIHGMASNAYPAFESMDATTFTKLLGAGEIALGSALLVPFVSSTVAGAGLAAFSGGLLGLYMRTPGMRMNDSVRPSPEGLGLAKDSWLAAIGTGLVVDSLVTRGRRAATRSTAKAGRTAARAGRKAAKAGQAAANGRRKVADATARSALKAGRMAAKGGAAAGETVGEAVVKGRTLLHIA